MLLQDARYAMRTLSRSPSFTVAAVAALALGIGASSAMFSVIDGVLVRPLPFPDSERIVQVLRTFRQGKSQYVSLPLYALADTRRSWTKSLPMTPPAPA